MFGKTTRPGILHAQKRFMNQLLRRAALLVLFILGTIPHLDAAPPKPKIPAKVVYIAIVSVDATAMTVTVEPRNSMSTEKKTYKVTPATAVKVNGNPATLADLKSDMAIHFTVAPDNVTATELAASRPPVGSE